MNQEKFDVSERPVSPDSMGERIASLEGEEIILLRCEPAPDFSDDWVSRRRRLVLAQRMSDKNLLTGGGTGSECAGHVRGAERELAEKTDMLDIS